MLLKQGIHEIKIYASNPCPFPIKIIEIFSNVDDPNIIELYHPDPKQIIKPYEKNKWVGVIRVQGLKRDNVLITT